MSKVETAIASFHGEEFKFFFPNKECVQYNQMKESGKFCEENLLQKIWSMGLGGAYLDIGGNIGNHAIFFANFCDCDRVVTFEPTPRFIRCLEMNVDVNNMKDKIQIVKAAVSNHEGRGRMKNGGGGEENEILIAGDSVDVVKLRADNFAYEVGLIKVDTEGTELNALKGCETIIQRDSPVIVAECVTIRRFRAIYDFLLFHGYQSNGLSYTPTAPTFIFSKVKETAKVYNVKVPDNYGDN